MANDYFNHAGSASRLASGTKARADAVNSLLDAVETGLDKLPTEQQNNRGTRNYAANTGAANAYACTLSHVSGSYATGQSVVLNIAAGDVNTSTSCVLNVSAIGNAAIKYPDGQNPAVGDLIGICEFRYNGTVWHFTSTGAASTVAAAASATAASNSADAAAASATAASNSADAAAVSASYFPNVSGAVSSTNLQLNYVDVAAGTATASKALVLDASKNASGIGTLTGTAWVGSVTGNVTGNASTATALATSRSFSITGDATASAVGFNGTGNVTLTVSLDAGVVDTTELATGAVTGIKLNAMTAGNERVSLYEGPVVVIGGGYVLNMECRASSNGVVRVSRTHSHANVLSRVYINFVAGPAAKGGVAATYTDDVAVTEGDLIQIYTNTTTSGPFEMTDIWIGVDLGVAVIGDWRAA